MMIKQIAITALPLAMAAGVAMAKPNSPIEQRGYERCVKEFQKETHQLVPDRNYLISKGDTAVMYYLNGSARTDAGRSKVRIACETAKRGQRVLSTLVAEGRYVPATNVRIEVANK